MDANPSDDLLSPEPAESIAARAVSCFLNARDTDPHASPSEFAPPEPIAAHEFWKAIRGLGVFVTDPRPSEAEASTNAPGELEAPGYQLIERIGGGGMGIVYRARQLDPERVVALKILSNRRRCDTLSDVFIHREAQALAQLNHPCIATLYETGHTASGQRFFTMELVDGIPVTEYVHRTKLDLRRRLELFQKICKAVNYAHQHSVIHRDLKPSNILIDLEGNPKILDFGFAKILNSDNTQSTACSIVGTPEYMSPEQSQGQSDQVDLRTDVYSLGVILYELLTGRLPYDVRHVPLNEASHVICHEPPRRPSLAHRVLRGDVVRITLKALQKDATQRYQNALQLANDVVCYLNVRPLAHGKEGGALYKFRKLLIRRRARFAYAALLFLMVTGSMIGQWALIVANLERIDMLEGRLRAPRGGACPPGGDVVQSAYLGRANAPRSFGFEVRDSRETELDVDRINQRNRERQRRRIFDSTGVDIENEWGVLGGRRSIYQARPLTIEYEPSGTYRTRGGRVGRNPTAVRRAVAPGGYQARTPYP